MYPEEFNFYDNYYQNDGKFYAKFPLGESPFDVALRTKMFIDTIYRDKEDVLFVISHGTTIRTIVMNYLTQYSYVIIMHFILFSNQIPKFLWRYHGNCISLHSNKYNILNRVSLWQNSSIHSRTSVSSESSDRSSPNRYCLISSTTCWLERRRLWISRFSTRNSLPFTRKTVR